MIRNKPVARRKKREAASSLFSRPGGFAESNGVYPYERITPPGTGLFHLQSPSQPTPGTWAFPDESRRFNAAREL